MCRTPLQSHSEFDLNQLIRKKEVDFFLIIALRPHLGAKRGGA